MIEETSLRRKTLFSENQKKYSIILHCSILHFINNIPNIALNERVVVEWRFWGERGGGEKLTNKNNFVRR